MKGVRNQIQKKTRKEVSNSHFLSPVFQSIKQPTRQQYAAMEVRSKKGTPTDRAEEKQGRKVENSQEDKQKAVILVICRRSRGGFSICQTNT